MKKRPLACSDDEAEAEVQSLSVSSYHLVDDDDVPVSFSVLPIQWGDSESATKGQQIFLHGFADNGLRKIFMQVTAWRFDVSYVKPKISLLSKDKRWIRLQKPRKSFLDTVRTVLVTLHILHRVKKNPRISATSLWSNLCKDKDLSSYGFKPSRKDLLDHMSLIGEAAKRDSVLAQSKLLLTILGEKPGNQKLSDEEVKDLAQPGFIVDGTDNDMIDEANEDSEADDNLFYSVCALCDNGGNVLCCDGGCMRSFHATKEDARESKCDSLGFTQKEVNEIQSFYCKNCEYNLHQCFACGKLGSSDKVKGAKVTKCASANCDRFYHPLCAAKLLPQVVKHVAEELERNNADGDLFTCPIHYCCVCKELENKMEPELQFAVCRRCPKSYHRKCLPREIAFDDVDDEGIVRRAWEGLLPNNRILIYCLNHEMDDVLGTPIRDHIKFPDTKATVREIYTTNKRMKPTTQERVILKKNNVGLDNSSAKSTAKGSKVTGKLSSSKVDSKKSSEKMISGSNISRKLKSNKISRCLTANKKSISKKFKMPDCEENKSPIGEKFCAFVNKGSERIKHDNQVDDVVNETLFVKPIRSALPPLDADSERRLEGVLKKHTVASTHTCSLGNVVEKTITMGKLEGSIDAVQTALRKLEGGRSIQDVKAVCDPDVLKQIFKWKDKRPAVNGVLPEGVPDHCQPHPIDGRSSVEGLQPISVMACAHVEVGDNDYGNLDPISDFGRSYSGIEKGPSFASPLSDCGVTNIEEHHSRKEEKYRRESDIRRQVVLSGIQDPDSTRSYHLSGRDTSCGYIGYSYAQLSPVTESSDEINTPVMERYAPRADELNHVSVSSLGSEPPPFSRSGTLERSVPLPGFAPGPHHHACSRHNSAGWLDE